MAATLPVGTPVLAAAELFRMPSASAWGPAQRCLHSWGEVSTASAAPGYTSSRASSASFGPSRPWASSAGCHPPFWLCGSSTSPAIPSIRCVHAGSEAGASSGIPRAAQAGPGGRRETPHGNLRGGRGGSRDRGHVHGREREHGHEEIPASAANGSGQQSKPLQQTIAAIDSMVRSLRDGRTIKDVTLDPLTAKSADELTQSLRDLGWRGSVSLYPRGPRAEPQVLSPGTVVLLVKAVSAFSRMRLLHAPLVVTLGEMRIGTWRDIPPPQLAEAMVAYAHLLPSGLADIGLRRRWAVALDEGICKRFAPQDLANVAWAAAVLQMGGLHRLGARLGLAADACDLGRLGAPQLGKLAWGLAKLSQHRASDKPSGGQDGGIVAGNYTIDDHPSWARNALILGKTKHSAGGHGLGELLWFMSTLGKGGQHARSFFERAPVKHLGKDAYSVLLRDTFRGSSFEILVLRHLADHCASQGLRAAVLNAAVIRSCDAGNAAEAQNLLEYMAAHKLWTPVTYRVAGRVATALGTDNLGIQGSPAFPGLVEPGPGAHKYVRALYHAFQRGQLGDSESALEGLEHFSRSKGWLKFGAADEKGAVVDDAVRRFRDRTQSGDSLAIAEFGTFLGYSAVRMARAFGAGAKIVTLESDPEVACLAINFIEFSGVDADIDVWIGNCEDLAPRLREHLGARSVGLVYMDHNQMIYHEDLARLEALDVLADGALLVATQVLKPGAPLLLWRLRQAELAGRLSAPLELVSSPDCGCPLMEEWVVVAELVAFHGPGAVWEPDEAPKELRLLAAECNLMRWRTVQGLVNEDRWNAFVQHVRRSVERLVGVRSTRDVWLDPKTLAKARRLEYRRLDFF